MHISSHILKEQVHFQSRVCELFLAAYTAFSSQVAIAWHPYIHVGQCCGGSSVARFIYDNFPELTHRISLLSMKFP